MAGRGVDDRTRRKIISMYRAGKKTDSITEATGAARSTIYFILAEEGVAPSRQSGPRRRAPERPPQGAADEQLLEWALARVLDLERENGKLLERLRTISSAATAPI